jgi:hypothetical protein
MEFSIFDWQRRRSSHRLATSSSSLIQFLIVRKGRLHVALDIHIRIVGRVEHDLGE